MSITSKKHCLGFETMFIVEGWEEHNQSMINCWIQDPQQQPNAQSSLVTTAFTKPYCTWCWCFCLCWPDPNASFVAIFCLCVDQILSSNNSSLRKAWGQGYGTAFHIYCALHVTNCYTLHVITVTFNFNVLTHHVIVMLVVSFLSILIPRSH